MESLNGPLLGLTSLLLAILLGLTIWALKVIIDVRSGCGGCTEKIKNLSKRQGALEGRQDVLEANHGDLALQVGDIDHRVEALEGK